MFSHKIVSRCVIFQTCFKNKCFWPLLVPDVPSAVGTVMKCVPRCHAQQPGRPGSARLKHRAQRSGLAGTEGKSQLLLHCNSAARVRGCKDLHVLQSDRKTELLPTPFLPMVPQEASLRGYGLIFSSDFSILCLSY